MSGGQDHPSSRRRACRCAGLPKCRPRNSRPWPPGSPLSRGRTERVYAVALGLAMSNSLEWRPITSFSAPPRRAPAPRPPSLPPRRRRRDAWPRPRAGSRVPRARAAASCGGPRRRRRAAAAEPAAHARNALADEGKPLEHRVDEVAVLVEMGAALLGDGVELLGALGLGGDVTGLFEIGQRRINDAGARRVPARGLVFE